MSEKIVHLNEEVIKVELKELVRSSVEETLNGLLEQEAQSGTAGLPQWVLQPKSDDNIRGWGTINFLSSL